MHTHIPRSRAPIIMRGYPPNHVSPSYKVLDLLYTSIYIYIYITCIMQAHRVGKINQSLPMSQGYGLSREK